MKYLFIINDGPYGTEKAYNALRLAMSLQKTAEADVNISLIGDGVVNAIDGQNTPNGFYNIGRMLKSILLKNGKVKLWGSCMDARGLSIDKMVEGAQRSTMDELALLSSEADKILVF